MYTYCVFTNVLPIGDIAAKHQ